MNIKNLFSFFILLFSISAFSQTDSTKVAPTVVQAAEYPGGREAFRKEFMKMVYAYVDVTAYAVNGKFTFVISIDKFGNMKGLKSFPRVKNDAEFVQDMTFALKRIKKKWKPEMRDGKPVESTVVLEINFTTDHSDHGD